MSNIVAARMQFMLSPLLLCVALDSNITRKDISVEEEKPMGNGISPVSLKSGRGQFVFDKL